ncbi:MAG: PrsW family intramembrane metalloprotease [Anaerolineae bacterium]|nr:PrsW family intramembrane metalloprotease [Anaerolineae bacterium]
MLRRVLWLIAGLTGVGIILVVLVSGIVMLVLALGAPLAEDVAGMLMGGSVVSAGVGLGSVLIIMGWSGWCQQPSRLFYPRIKWTVWLALVGLFILGDILARASEATRLLLVPIHVLMMSAPALIVLSLVARWMRCGVSSWREMGTALTSGGFVGTVSSLIAEGISALAILFVLVLLLSQTSRGVEWLRALQLKIADPAWQSDPDQVLTLLASPIVVLLATFVVAVPVPIIEEAFKTIGMGILGRWYRPEPARGFLWGVASGAGFALVENLLNGAVSTGSDWGQVALARLLATIMHCFVSGIVGWGWAKLWAERRPLVLFGCYAAAVAIHSLWNMIAIALAWFGFAGEILGADVIWVRYAPVGVLLLVGFLAVMCVFFLVGLHVLSRRLSAEQPDQAAAAATRTAIPQGL